MLLLTVALPLFIAIVLYYSYKWAKRHLKNYRIMQKMPGPPARNIILGNMAYFQASPEKMFERLRECARNFYPVYKIFALHKVGACILSPEDCELIMSNPAHNEKGLIYKTLHKWLRFGLLTSAGTKWQTRRRILTPAFHFNILQQFILVFNEESEKLVDILKKECAKTSTDVNPHLIQFTLKTIAETAMGTKLEFQTQKEKNYKNCIFEMGEMLIYKITHPWCIEAFGAIINPFFFREMKVIKVLHNFTKEVIAEREKSFDNVELPKEEHDVYKGKKRLAMLDLLLSAKRNEGIIVDEGIHEEVETFMFEGHDTTTVALGFILMLLANHKEAQDSILQEMTEVLGDVHKKPTYADFQNLKYMERCIKESLRLYPSVPLVSRTLGEDLTLHSGYLIPGGANIVIHIYDIHRNADIYPDPERFDPDRFLPENIQNRHPFSYLPFSAGPRNCIGQRFAMLELKAVVLAILRNFVLEAVDTPDTIVLVVDLVLRTKDGIRVKFVPREL